MKGGNLIVIEGKWGVDPNSKQGNTTTNAYRLLELKVFTALEIPITTPNSNNVLRDKILVEKYRVLCAACTTPECYDALNGIKKEIRQIIQLRNKVATEHVKENETAQEEIDRIGHEGRVELWRNNYEPINEIFHELRKKLHKPFEVDTDILTDDKRTISEKKRLVSETLGVIMDNIRSIDENLSIALLSELQVDLREIITKMPETQVSVAEGEEKLAKIPQLLIDLNFIFKEEAPRILELTAIFGEELKSFTFSKTLPEMIDFSESLVQFTSQIEEELTRVRGVLETRRIKLEKILLTIQREEDHLLAEEKEEQKLEAEESARVKQEVIEANARFAAESSAKGASDRQRTTKHDDMKQSAEDLRIIEEHRQLLAEEKITSDRIRREKVVRELAEGRERLRVEEEKNLLAHLKKISELKSSLALTTKEHTSNEPILFEIYDKIKNMEKDIHPDTKSKYIDIKRIIFILSTLSKDDKKGQKELIDNMSALEAEIIKSEYPIKEPDLHSLKDNITDLYSLKVKLHESEHKMKVESAELSKMEKELPTLPGYSEKILLQYRIKELEQELERIVEAYPVGIKEIMSERVAILDESFTLRRKIISEGGDPFQNGELNGLMERLHDINRQILGVDKKDLDDAIGQMRISKEKLSKLKGGRKTRRVKR